MKLLNWKYILLAAGLFLLGFNAQSLWRWNKASTAEENSQNNSTDQSMLLSYNMMEQMASTSLPVGLSFLMEDPASKKRLLSKLDSGAVLAVRVSPLSCGMCVDSTLVSVSRFIRENDVKSRIIILTSYRRERDLILFRRLHQIDIEVFNIMEDDIALPIEREKKPYMFVLDSSLTSKSLFIPEKTNLWLTKFYLSRINTQYFKNK